MTLIEESFLKKQRKVLLKKKTKFLKKKVKSKKKYNLMLHKINYANFLGANTMM